MKNLGQMMKQAQELQDRMQAMREELESLEVEGASGGGMVGVVLNGKGEMRRIELDPAIVDPAEKDVLEDLIVAAVNDARAKADRRAEEEMRKLTGGLPLPPGLKLPF